MRRFMRMMVATKRYRPRRTMPSFELGEQSPCCSQRGWLSKEKA
jgi:hypothetical protein